MHIIVTNNATGRRSLINVSNIREVTEPELNEAGGCWITSTSYLEPRMEQTLVSESFDEVSEMVSLVSMHPKMYELIAKRKKKPVTKKKPAVKAKIKTVKKKVAAKKKTKATKKK